MFALGRRRHKGQLAPVAESVGVIPQVLEAHTWGVRPLANAQPIMNDQIT
jgi:hypothetical protein